MGFSPYLVLMVGRGLALMLDGHLAEARTVIARAEQLAIEHGDGDTMLLTCVYGGQVASRAGDVGGALRFAVRALELGEQSASAFFLANGNAALAEALVATGEHDAAVAAALRGLDIVRRHQQRIVFMELPLLASLARAQLGAGQPDHARATAIEAMGLCERHPDPRFSAVPAATAAAEVLLRTDGATPAAIRALELAESLASAIPDRCYQPRLLGERAELARLRGDERERHRLLDDAASALADIGAGHLDLCTGPVRPPPLNRSQSLP